MIEKEVNLCAHYKQGDDLAHVMRSNPGLPATEVLKVWADDLIATAESIREAAMLLSKNSKEVEVFADTHHISFHNVDESLYDELEQVGVIHLIDLEFDEEEYAEASN